LSSWLGRIACRYGLDAPTLASCLEGPLAEHPIVIDDVACDPGRLKHWARACGVDPARPRRLMLAERHPRRPSDWFAATKRGAARAVCPACFDRDQAAGRDGYLRASWALAERCVCPAHARILIDQCPFCKSRLSIAFRLREGLARPVCATCERPLSDRAGEAVEGALVASRPVLALWCGERGWRCPVEVRQIVGIGAPLARLRVPWRCLTLIALRDLGVFDQHAGDETVAEPVRCLLRRAAPKRRPSIAAHGARSMIRPAPRPAGDYERMAREILSGPAWLAAVDQPEPKRRRVLGQLMWAALEPSPPRREARQAAVQ
jgi:hypothetical protein